jgi:hypothetical protein
MPFELKEKEFDILKAVAECRLLTANQIAILLGRNKQYLRRKLSELENQGCLLTQSHEFGRSRGRPGRLFSITKQGIDILKSQGILAEKTPYEKVLAESITTVDHQMMMNCFRVHLSYLQTILDRIKIHFLSCNSPFLPETESGHCFITNFVADAASKRMFTPDGVFIITDTIEAKSLLFFLEVDCGSETLASPERHI